MDDGDLEELARDYQRLLAFMDGVPDGVFFKDRDHRYVRVNDAMVRLLGAAAATDVLGKSDHEVVSESRGREVDDEEHAIVQTGTALRQKVERRSDPEGVVRWLCTTKIAWRDREARILGVIGVTSDITAIHERTKVFLNKIQDILLEILNIGLTRAPLAAQLDLALARVLAVPWLPLDPKGGVFLAEGSELRLVAQRGLPPDVQRRCGRLQPGQCLCGLAALHGQVVHAEHVDERHDIAYEGIPAHGHYCVPIRGSDSVIGVAVLYLDDGHERDPSEEKCLQMLAQAMGSLIEHERERRDVDRASRLQHVLNSIIHVSVQPVALDEQLDRTLDLILSCDWIALESRGCIFLVEGDPPELVMHANRGLAEHLLTACARLPFGKCLCGRAAATRQICFRDRIDDEHEIQFPGMRPHGHYCVPIESGDQLLGVLNLYVSPDYQRSVREEEFVAAVSSALAGMIVRKRAEEALVRMATEDENTGLANRNKFADRLRHAVAQARRYGHVGSLLFLDLDGFKLVNDVYGHDIGDLVLREVALRLRASARESDTVARLGGDEFAIVLTRVAQIEDAAIVARRIIDVLRRPFDVGGHQCTIGVSIGISVFPNHGETADHLVKCADDAMYAVKRAGRNGYRYHEASDPRPDPRP